MKFLNGWIDIPEEKIQDIDNDDFLICDYCVTCPDECGEWMECCHNGVVREAIVKCFEQAVSKVEKDIKKTEKTEEKYETIIIDFKTGKRINWGDS